MCGVMIVDDEALILCDLAMTVESLGYELHSESTCIHTAMKALEGEKPDVALLDIDVGGEPVWPLARAVASTGSPIVFISANLHHSELKEEFAECAQLEKPVSDRDVAAVLKSALE